ncbi:bifunctional riboflavin kinase/FAD synthetase [Gulosibacter bifidus]|uniref:Riboflavin biosynthesis protein n=1 Tax=Gulosibacter bifidus TaxID=272239 RepID=A0ABW5RHT2_9MICO|nr:bifunctional riboflavin kinase/FAD synthetase [Gulosibacter bifidus]
MHIITDPAKFPEALRPSAITIGKFDGVHAGHMALINRVIAAAQREQCAAVVVTFDRHPMELFAPERAPKPIMSLEYRMRLLAQTGVDAVIVLPFTRELSELSPEGFIEQLLCEQLGMRALVIGDDFRFGHRGAGDVNLLRERSTDLGFALDIVSDVTEGDGVRASSSLVRALLADGEVQRAARILQRNHTVRGTVVHGAKRGRELGFLTANLSPRDLEGFIPADGVYAGYLHVDERMYPSAISIGNNPTFDGVPQQQIEAYVLDETLDLYGKLVTVEFVDRVRPMVKFESLDALIEGIRNDVRRVRELLELTQP